VSTYSVIRSESALLRDWGESRAPVYFDFGEVNDAPPLMNALWRLHPDSNGGTALVSPMLRAEFVNAHLNGEEIEKMLAHIIERDTAYYKNVESARMNTATFPGRGARRRSPRF
jgi:hypothetical protein